MMFSKSISILAIALMAGCAAQRPSVAPGKSGLVVKVIAEPKYAGASNSGDVYSTSDVGDVYERLDYENLPGIVMWVETSAPFAEQASSASIGVPLDDHLQRRFLVAQGVPVGATLNFQNTTDHPLSVFSVSPGNTFDLGNLAPAQSANVKVQSPGVIEVLCESSDDPIALLYAVPSSYIRTVRSNEVVTFLDLPPGETRITCWHARLPGSSQLITLKPDQVSEITLKAGVKVLHTFP